MKCNHPKESLDCSFHYNGLCMRDHNYECPALVEMKKEQMILNTEAELKKAGFSHYRSGSLDIAEMYQKRYDDEVGKKYFINAILYKPLQHPVTGTTITFPYKFEVMLAQRGTGNPVKMEFFSGWELADVEEYTEKIWGLGLWDYYEEWPK